MNNRDEYFFDEESHTIDVDTMQALGLNMYSKLLTPKKMLYNAFCRSDYDNEVVMHPQQIECLNYLMRGDNLLISAPTSFGKTFVALEYMSRKELNNIVILLLAGSDKKNQAKVIKQASKYYEDFVERNYKG